MSKLLIKGGNRLSGTVDISGAKNAAVAILPAAILASRGVCVIENIPNIQDVHCFGRILKNLGCNIKIEKDVITIDSLSLNNWIATTEDVGKMRAPYYLIGALLGRFKKAIVKLPGGCPIGKRPIDQHIKGFKALGAQVYIKDGIVYAEADKLIGNRIYFDVVSVGATINVMLAASMAEGVTILENPAKEPHVVDIANFLNAMGANIKGAGTDTIRITGVKKLEGCNYSIIPDQIEAATYMMAVAACGGEVVVKNVIPKHLEAIMAKMTEMGVKIIPGADFVKVISDGKLKAVNVKTLPYPGFPTDIQQPMTTLLSIADGRSIVNESIYENRFGHVHELNKMGAHIKVKGRIAVIDGVDKLKGAEITSTDLRAGAALIIAGLVAEGETLINGVEHIDRGYPDIEYKFREIGSDITRISD